MWLKMNRSIFSLLVIAAFFAGCTYPVVENPLVQPGECKPSPELHGVYKTVKTEEKGRAFLHIGTAGEDFPPGFLKFIVVQHPDETNQRIDASSFVAFAEPISESYLVHIPMPSECVLDRQLEMIGDKWDIEKIDEYILFRLSRTETGLAVSLLDNEFISEQIENKKLLGQINQDVDNSSSPPKIGKRTIRITASARELRRFFEETPLDKIFEEAAIEFQMVE